MRNEIESRKKGTPLRKGTPFGFTLAELIVVITVLAILATAGFVMLSGHLSSARDSSRATEVGQVSRAVELSAVQNGKYPMPVAAEGAALVSFTGGASGNAVVTQWAATAANVRDLGGSFGKKKQTGPFTYSVLGDGAAYQVAAEFENGVSASPEGFPDGTPEAYALAKTAYVEGTYRADPSLPSLVVSSGSVTGTGLFSPDACFVTHGGANLPSSSAGCVPKKSFALKSLDSALVGYWDMETFCVSGSCGAGNDGKLADLSGNGGHGTWGNGIVIGWTGGISGKGTQFNSGSLQYVRIPESAPLRDLWKNFTISTSFHTDVPQGGIFLVERYSSGTVRDYAYGNYVTLWTWSGAVSTYVKYWPTLNEARSWGDYYAYAWKFHQLTGTYDGKTITVFMDGKKIGVNAYPDEYSAIWTPGDVFIGWWIRSLNASVWTFFQWTVDEVKIYSRTISDDEIFQQSKVAWF